MIRSALLRWFGENAREMPWRGSDDPYAVLVCEVMSQQTRIDTVRDYWTRWMVEFPTLRQLAAAHESDVMRMWAGLGYYRRARNLHACARYVVANGGELPPTAAELATLPGIGPYTAAAVASIVFGEAVAAVDGNVSRVVARLHALEGDPTRAPFRRAVASHVAPLIDPDRAGASNEALMELGATICTPRAPSCAACPVADWCAARAQGDPTAFPWPKPRKAPRRQTRTCVVAYREPGEVFVRRGTEQLLGGLWEFPTYDEDAAGALALVEPEHGLVGCSEAIGSVEHLFSHITMTYEILHVRVVGSTGGTDGIWMAIDALEDAGMSVAMRRVAAAVTKRALHRPSCGPE